jgi:homogentisate 1,2-dioxygenase
MSRDRDGQGAAYLSGLGNELQTEALPGALPIGQNSPQRPPLGLVSELVSGTTFTAPRALNRRSYVFRIRPSVLHGRFERRGNGRFSTPPFGTAPSPNHYCWHPFQRLEPGTDFVDGIATLLGNGSPSEQAGMAVHAYTATASMVDRVFSNGDGEMLIVPHVGALRVHTEYGILELGLGELAVVPRATKLRVEILDGHATGFVCENFGLPLRLPELGLIGSNGLANVADFEIPVAAFEERRGPIELVHKFAGNLWSAPMDHSPLDVVAWRGTLYPYKYDLRRFVGMGTVTIDHPDPSIFSVLTSPSDSVLGPNFDVMAITPRWVVAERSFRPPGYHRNCVAEFIALLQGPYAGLPPGSTTLTNHWTEHGPETETVAVAREMPLDPVKMDDILLVLIESRFPVQVTELAETAVEAVRDYTDRWKGFEPYFRKP